MSLFYKKSLFLLSFCFFHSVIIYFLLLPLYQSNSIYFPYCLTPFDLCKSYPLVWSCLKFTYLIFHLLSSFIISNSLYSILFLRKKVTTQKVFSSEKSSDQLQLLIGYTENHTKYFLPEKGLYQNILVTGTIGSGKTSSALYPFLKQLLSYQSSYKLGMLILDVKGNFYQKVVEFCHSYHRSEDLILIELGGNNTYNPLDKPHLKPLLLANRLKTILELFSMHNSDSYWFDKAQDVLMTAIKFCRLYHSNYVTFSEIHQLVTNPNYYLEKIPFLKKNFLQGNFDKTQCFDLLSCLNFFEKEFFCLDERVLSILKSEITRITNCFISDLDVLNTFSPDSTSITFSGFKEVLENGKIVVLKMNLAEHRNLSKIIAAYLKLDFQSEVLSQLSKNCIHPSVFICDEFHEYVTLSDADFFAQSREAKCINIVATQSYSSLLNTLKDPTAVKTITQNLVNKLWFRTDDLYTIEEIQKQLGKEDKVKISKTISENAKETNYSYLLNAFTSSGSNLSEGINTYTQNEFIYDTNFFSQKLETFSCLAFLSNGFSIQPPCKLSMIPYFKDAPPPHHIISIS